MATYRFRCEEHGDFLVDQPMASTTSSCPCGYGPCGLEARKVLSGNFQYFGGRAAFHDGVEGTGETGRETRDRWIKDFERTQGHKPEPAGVRWV